MDMSKDWLERAKKFLFSNKESLRFWGSFLLFGFILFMFFSDGDFSFILTLGSMLSMFGFIMVAYSIETSKSCAGVSIRMIECYLIVYFFRLCSIIPYEGYLPYDRSGDWLYQTQEAITFCLVGSIVYLCRVRYISTHNASADTLNHLYLIGPCAILALIFHPSLNAFMPADVAWTFALYLESLTVLPQLFMFQSDGKVEAYTTHFLAGQAASKALSFIFWAHSASELNDPEHHLKAYVGIWVMVMQIIQLIVMGDFIYHYVRCLQRGIPMNFLLADTV